MGFMEGPGREQNNAVLGQTEPHDHPAPNLLLLLMPQALEPLAP